MAEPLPPQSNEEPMYDEPPLDFAEGSGDESAEDPEEEDHYEQIRNMMENPVIQPIQAALKKQLVEANLRVGADVRDKESELTEVKGKRELIGVELYGVQQQLAKLQMDLENKHGALNQVVTTREKAQDNLEKLNQQLEEVKEIEESETKKLEKNQNDLAQLQTTLRQVTTYNEELKGEVAVTRRATYKAEEAITKLERAKGDQDIFIDTLNENLKKAQEQRALFEAQYASQASETQAAVDTLRDATKEMETIEFEKKQLMQQWKSSLIGMRRRDEALGATTDAIHEQIEEDRASLSEIQGYKKAIRGEQAENEKIMGVMNKLDSEAEWMKTKMKDFADERSVLQERFELLKKSLQQTVSTQDQVYADYDAIVHELKGLEKNLEAVSREKIKVEAEILLHKAEQVTHVKGAKNLAKEAAAIQEVIQKHEQEESSVLNEMARIRVDILNTKSHNDSLQKTTDSLIGELTSKDKLIEKYEMEIRQRNDQIEKKMHTVDRLNRKYEALVAGEPEEENLGPLEATIKHIQKETIRMDGDNREMEKRWLRTQTELVAVSDETVKQQNLKSQIGSQEAILEQKRMRVDRNIGLSQKDISSIKKGIHGLHLDMSRLNELIHSNTGLHQKLANENYALETEFVEELKEMEQESVKMESEIKILKDQKKELLQDIIESERQLLLWEKKIQLEKETQETLDPSVGVSEGAAMEREIHRMRLRYEAIKRDQDRMVNEMERAVMKREVIAQKYKKNPSAKKSGHDKGMTTADLKKKRNGIQREAKRLSREVRGHEEQIAEKMILMDNMAGDLEKASAEYSKLEDEANELQKNINNKLYEKQRTMDMVQKNSRLLDRFTKARLGQMAPLLDEDGPSVDEELRKESQARDSIRASIEHLSGQHNHLAEVLARVYKLTEV